MADPHHGDLISKLSSTIGRYRRQIRRLAGSSFDQQSISASQAELLRLVGRNPGVSVSAAATELGLAANSASTLVTALAGADLLLRDQDPHDRRIGRLTLTADAQRLADDTRRRRHELLSSALDALTPSERADLRKGVEVIAHLTEILHQCETGVKR